MAQARFILLPTVAMEPYLGLLCHSGDVNGEGNQEVTLWERICRIDPSIVPPEPCTNSCCAEKGDISQKRSMAACARWGKHRDQLRMYEDKSSKMVKARTNGRNTRDVACQTEDSWVCNMERSKSDQRERLCRAFVDQALSNLKRRSPRYNQFSYQVSALLYFTSAKSYRLLRQIVKLPAISCIYDKFQTKQCEITQRLLDLNKVDETLAEIQDSINKKVTSGQYMNAQFTLGIDAFCFRSFSGCKLGSCSAKAINQIVSNFTRQGKVQQLTIDEENAQFSHGFVFLLIPHDYRLPTRIVHLKHSKTGCYNDKIAKIAEYIRERAKKKELRIVCKATDGDPGVSKDHTDFFNDHVYKQSANFQQLVARVYTWLSTNPDAIIPIADPLHVFKNLRARMMQHPIILSPTWQATCLEKDRVILGLGNVLSDETQVGKMRDSYVVALFTLHNVVKLLNAGQFVDAYLLFPFACWMAVIRYRSLFQALSH